jgi:hypothetical protein
LLLEEKADQAPVGVPAESPYCSRPKLVVGVFASLPEVGLARRDVARGLTPSFSSNEINIKKKRIGLETLLLKWVKIQFVFLPVLGLTGELVDLSRPSSNESFNANLS